MRKTIVLLLLAALGLSACGSSETKTVVQTVAAEQAPGTTPTTRTEPAEAEAGDEPTSDTATKTVDRSEVLKLRSLAVRVDDISVTDAISDEYGDTDQADGVFVVVKLSVRNRSNAPQSLTTGGGEQVGMLIGERQFNDDFEVQNGYAEDSFMWQGKEIQPGGLQTGTVVFDIPRAAAKRIDQEGQLVVVNFGDAVAPGYLEEATEVGLIRLWQ